MRRTFALFLMLLIVSLSACSTVQQPANADRELVVALPTGVDTLDPSATIGRPNHIVASNILDKLAAYDPDGKITLMLAKKITSIDPKTWEVELKTGISFTNGEPFDAEAVKYSLEKSLNDKSPIVGLVRPLTAVEVVAPDKVRFNLKAPDALFVERLTVLWIYPPKYGREKGEAFGDAPIGTGPYMFDEWMKGDWVSMKANPNWWGGEVPIKRVRFRGIPEIATQITELLAGNVHIVRQVPPDQVAVIEKSKVARVDRAAGVRTDWLQIDYLGMAGASPLQDLKVRQAIAHGINVKGIATDVLKDMVVDPGMLWGRSHVGYDPQAKVYAYDPQKARDLLADAGYPKGLKLQFTTFAGNLQSPKQMAEAMQADLAKIGVEVEIKFFEQYSQFSAMVKEHKVQHLFMNSGGNSGFSEPDPFMSAFFRSDAPLSYVQEPEIDRLSSLARTQVSREDRAATYAQIQRIAMEKALVVPLWVQAVVYAASNDVDFRVQPDDFLYLVRIKWK